MTSADYLRTTAADMRAKAEAADTRAAWFGAHQLRDQEYAEAALIAHASPTFVMEVAAWLVLVADGEHSGEGINWRPGGEAWCAMSVARVWNGEA